MKLSVYCVVKDDTFYLDMMIKSALNFADEIVIVEDTKENPSDNKKLCDSFKSEKIIYKAYPFGQHFGEGRQFANDLCTGDWIFALDADEVIHQEQYDQIKKYIAKGEKDGIELFHVQYIHFIHDFGHVDNSEGIHIGLSRLYRNYEGVDLKHNKNHSLPTYDFKKVAFIPIIIWHLGYLRGMSKIAERFKRNFTSSEIHSPLHQIAWRDWHYFGDYPTKIIDIYKIPDVIREKFSMTLGGGQICQEQS